MRKYSTFMNPLNLTISGLGQKAKAVTTAVADGTKAVTKAVSGAPVPAPPKPQGFMGKAMGKVFGGDTAQGIPQAGLMDRALAVGTVASIPIGIAGMVAPSADTRAVQAMRAQDTAREARGLAPLAATPQMIKDKATQVGQMATNTLSNNDGVRVTNPMSNMQLPPPLPPNSMR